MGDGTLPRETFKYYMVQDYLYLVSWRYSVRLVEVSLTYADTLRQS